MLKLNKEDLFNELLKNGQLIFDFPQTNVPQNVSAQCDVFYQLHQLELVEMFISTHPKTNGLSFYMITKHNIILNRYDVKKGTGFEQGVYEAGVRHLIDNTLFTPVLANLFSNEKLKIM